LNSPAHWIKRRWIIQKLEQHWNSQTAEALNRFLRRPDGWASDRIQATALLLHHHSLESDLLAELALSEKKENRWLAQYARAVESKSQHDVEFIQHDLAHSAGTPALLP
jgi:hypothetical protein